MGLQIEPADGRWGSELSSLAAHGSKKNKKIWKNIISSQEASEEKRQAEGRKIRMKAMELISWPSRR
jgi:hypothetical protein